MINRNDRRRAKSLVLSIEGAIGKFMYCRVAPSEHVRRSVVNMTHQKSRYESTSAFLIRCKIAAQDNHYSIDAGIENGNLADDRAVGRKRDKMKVAQTQLRYCDVAKMRLVVRQQQRFAQTESAEATPPARLECLVVERRLEMHA